MKNIVTNIQKFCLQDGPGIRTTIFFKGCNLRCPWCSNPENISFEIEKSIDNKITYGKEYTCEELFNEIVKDKVYYANNGGVTFSGGEPLWHIKEIEPLLKKLKENMISIAFETTLTVPKEYVIQSLDYCDYYLVDIKILNKADEAKINSNSDLFKENAKLLQNKNVKYRIPLAYDYTFTENNIIEIRNFLVDNNIKEVDVFNTHNLGKEKYLKLGKEPKEFKKIDESDIEKLKIFFEDIKINMLKI